MNRVLSDTGLPDAETVETNGSRFLSGNGCLGLRGTLDEYGKDEKTAVIVNGLYDKAGAGWREPVNAPNGCFIGLSCNGHRLHTLETPPVRHSQGLEFGHAIQLRTSEFELPDGTRVTIDSRRFVSLTEERLICVRYECSADRPAGLVLTAGIDGEVWDLNGPHLTRFEPAETDGIVSLSCLTGERAVPVAVCEFTDAPAEAQETRMHAERRVFRRYTMRAEPGRRYVFHKYVVVRDGGNDPLRLALEECRRAAAAGYERIEKAHRALWDERWNACGITIEGDDEAMTALEFSMYHLLASAPAFGGGRSIPARGLSGQVYKGGIFWDTEIFMLPFFQSAFPSIARTLLEYRIRTLDGARRKAAEYGHSGAFYAWESQDTGDDACTLFNVNDVLTGRPIRTFFRDRQIHISADIAWAVGRYCELTGDTGLLMEGGAEVIYECARFYLSWMHWKPSKERFELLCVTGPDEYHERVDNDFFTNFMAARTFRLCLDTDAALARHAPELRAHLIERTGMKSGIGTLGTVLEKLYIPQPDPGTGVVPQFDGYFALEDVPVPELLSRKLHENEYLGGGNGLACWTGVIKQADVLLAMSLDPDAFPAGTVRTNWEYYEPRTEHGSSLSACAYAVTAARIGRIEDAYRYFIKTAEIDLNGEGKRYVGDLYIGGTHPAANGGAWLAVVHGFAGIRAAGTSLTIEPALPPHWNRLTVPVMIRGRRIEATITRDRIELRADGRLPAGFTVETCGAEWSWNGTAPLVVRRTAEVR